MSRSSSRTTVGAFVAAMALAGSSRAAPPTAVPHSIVGTLQKVTARTLTVQTPKGVVTVMLVSTSQIHRGAAAVQPVNLSLYAGQRIKVRYVDSDGQKRATSVTLASTANAAGSIMRTSKPAAKPPKK